MSPEPSQIKPEYLYAAFTALGAAAFKFLEFLFRRRFDQDDDIRKELREDLAVMNSRLNEVHAEMDQWKQRYYTLYEDHLSVKQECSSLRQRIEQISGDSGPRNSSKPE